MNLSSKLGSVTNAAQRNDTHNLRGIEGCSLGTEAAVSCEMCKEVAAGVVVLSSCKLSRDEGSSVETNQNKMYTIVVLKIPVHMRQERGGQVGHGLEYRQLRSGVFHSAIAVSLSLLYGVKCARRVLASEND